MPIIRCRIANCTHATEDVDASIAASLLIIHNNVHIATPAAPQGTVTRRNAPKIDRPKISMGSSEEVWNAFSTRWGMFKRGTTLSADELVQHLFQCCEDDLGDAILRAHPTSVNGSEANLLAVIKQMAVIPVAICVRRAELLSTKQDHGESARTFSAKLKGKAATCAYTVECTSDACTQVINFTDVIVKDVLVAGLVDEEIKREVLGWSDLDFKSLDDLVTFIEAKEMARNALNKQTVAAGVSAYKLKAKNDAKHKTKTLCKTCRVEIDKYVWNKRQGRSIECTLCLPCWKKANPRKEKTSRDDISIKDEGGFTCESSNVGACEQPNRQQHRKEIILDNYIFDSHDGWKKSESMSHPTLRLRLTVAAEDYEHVKVSCPEIMPSYVTAITDTGAQSCLWSLNDFYRCGFTDSDLLPVKRTMFAANREEIKIVGAIFLRLSGTDVSGKTHTAPIMAYVSPSTNRIYLSRQALIQLAVIPKNFPKVGAAVETATIESPIAPCGCPTRSLPPGRPESLPYAVCPENNAKMKSWLFERYSTSTFNKCTHQLLKGVTGPPLRLHVDPDAKPNAVHTPSTIPLHWEEQVKKQILSDVELGVLETVPHGEPSLWCHRMVVARKPSDGSPRRTVDMAALNKVCSRETHHVKPPFHQARSIPPNTWKSVTDAWNGFHSVPLAEEDRQYTTFITPWGRFRYRMAPQGALASGDGYSRRYDEIISDFERKTKCVDDTAMWDDDLESHWWRVIDFLELCGQNGIILNFDKFQFAQREIAFAGFYITETEVKPLDKYVKAIAEFPTPKRTTDIRSWFGLVHQVSHYSKLTNMLEPFKPFLSPKKRFEWNAELDNAFESSKGAIIKAIRNGVQIFDPAKLTCLRSDWSQHGIGYFLSQKHCECETSTPGCCENGWRITLAGSRFLKPAETRYAAIEGEALAIAWSLEHTKYFSQGCDKLVVVTDHKPLVQLFNDKALDQISNSRLFSIKQRTLPWKFTVCFKPGKDNMFSDATSRNPTHSTASDESLVPNAEILAGIMQRDFEEVEVDHSIAALSPSNKPVRAITWELVKEETFRDDQMRNLVNVINSAFPDDRSELPAELLPYWSVRNNLYVVDGVILMRDQVLIPPTLRDSVICASIREPRTRVIIPEKLRQEVVQSLHSAHQGVSSMNARAKAGVYWPGITKDIESVRANCMSCNRIMPSHSKMPPIEPLIPTTPFEAIACDYFDYMGHHYFVAADRLSGWIEVQQVKVGTNEAGATGLCTALRRFMVTFGVPVEISSDGGPEFVSGETTNFFKKWGISHRLSSVCFPSSNGRAELGVKSAKRLLMDNVGPSGTLDNDGMVRALLTYRNTPDIGCKLSPAQILFGRPLRDTLPCINKDIMIFNNPTINPQWKEAWSAKEEALKTRYVKSLENLREHARPLPPLRHGNHVLIQNQYGRFPKKWGKSGTIVETKGNDQYVVKTAGSGRLTLRNRRFLRRYEPHVLQQTDVPVAHPPVVPNDTSVVPYTENAIPVARHPPSTPDVPPHSRNASDNTTSQSAPQNEMIAPQPSSTVQPPVVPPIVSSSPQFQFGDQCDQVPSSNCIVL